MMNSVADTIERTYYDTRPRGYKTFFMLNSIKHEIFPAHIC